MDFINEMYEAVTGSKCNWDNEQGRCMENISGENHQWKPEEMEGWLINRSNAGKNLPRIWRIRYCDKSTDWPTEEIWFHYLQEQGIFYLPKCPERFCGPNIPYSIGTKGSSSCSTAVDVCSSPPTSIWSRC